MTTACAVDRGVDEDWRLYGLASQGWETRQRRARLRLGFGKSSGGWTSLSNRRSTGRWRHA